MDTWTEDDDHLRLRIMEERPQAAERLALGMDDRPVERPICFCAGCSQHREWILGALSVEARGMLIAIFLAAQGFADKAGEPVSFYHILESIDYVEHQVHLDWIDGIDDGGREALEALNDQLAEILP